MKWGFAAAGLLVAGVVSVQAVGTPRRSTASASSASSSDYRQVLDRYCVRCHDDRSRTAGLDLTQTALDLANPGAGAAVWEKVVKKLKTRAMPPPGMPRPDHATYEGLVDHLESALDRAADSAPDPGRPVLQRLNRAQYVNAVRDLLALEIGGDGLLPPDASSSLGFDNIGEVLTLSPLLMDRYLSAARKVSRRAIGDLTVLPVTATYLVPENLDQQGRAGDDLPLGTRGGTSVEHYFPLDAEYEVRIRLRESGPLVAPAELEIRVDGRRLNIFTLDGSQEATKDLVFRFTASAGSRQVSVAFLKDSSKASVGVAATHPGISWIAVGGPFEPTGVGDTPSRRQIFTCRPTRPSDEQHCGKQILSTLGRRAFRRPLVEQDVEHLLALFHEGAAQAGFEAGIGLALQGILISPEFLFRFERDSAAEPDGTHAVSDLELASRLSFFLWSSIPDDRLLDLGVRRRLRVRGTLEAEVQRLLRDRRSAAIVANFAEQWLHVRNLDLMFPDADVFPTFTPDLREAMRREVALLFEDMMRADRSVLTLLNADHTFLNEPLARHYGIAGVYGQHFRRVRLADENRWGLFGKGAVLTVTSYATRTSPTLRGKWILENILGTPPPPPPPDVPSLPDDGDAGKLTMRERLALHRTKPACASCHRLMDPPGFALENFDAVGRWRTKDADNNSVDASGELPSGARFDGPAALRRTLLDQREQFVTAFTEKLLTYALGRRLEHYDMPAVRRIVREAAADGYRWSSIVLGIVKSVPFQMRRARAS
jgi:hypothetical protein